MDKILLNALNNLSESLEQIAAALKKSKNAKAGTGPSSATGATLTKGDFGAQLKEISVEVRSIKKDTQEILNQQKTILEISKKKEKDKKTGLFEEAGGDKKSESNLKKGIGTILLIAVAVLAIGLAFKIVGKIDFLSVIGLAAAIFAISLAFERVAKLDLSLKEAFYASLTLVMMATAVTMSSWIMKLITPVGILQIMTAIVIAGMFAILAEKLETIFIAAGIFSKLRVSKFALITALVSISAAITMSSWILNFITPISFRQALTGILIAGMFAVVALNFEKIAFGVAAFDKLRISKLALLTTLVGIATAITMSSWIMTLIMPLTFGKAITAILIAAVFLVISLNFEKIALGIAAFDKLKISKVALLLTLVGIATAITLSSWVLSLVVPMGLMQFLTALGIALLFALMSYVMPQLAIGIVMMDKILGKGAAFLLPLMFVAIALAIMLSSHILSMSAEMQLSRILQIALFGVALAIMVLAMLPSVLLVGAVAASGVGAGAIALGVLMIPLIAAAIMISSQILAVGTYNRYPSWKWSLGVGMAMTLFAGAVVAMGAIALTGIGLVAVVAGLAIVPLIAMSIVLADKIIAKGKYDKFPGIRWILSVGTVMTAFGSAIIVLGALALTGIGLVAVLAGTMMVPMIAKTIVETDKIIGKGKYDKYPGWKWILSVGATMTGFGAAVVALGGLAITGFGLGALAIIVGTKMVPKIAQTIVDTDRIIGKGKYNKYPDYKWILSVGSTMAGFGAAVVTLGVLSISGFGLGALAIIIGTKMVPEIAKTIVATDKIISKGKYDKYPGWGWAASVGSLMTIFGAAVLGVGILIVSSLGLGYIAIKAGASAVKTIAQSIVDVAGIFAKSGSVWKKGPTKEWAEGVAISLGAFSPIYKMLMVGGIMTIFQGVGPSPKKFAEAIRTISQGIVDAANFFGAPGMSAVYKGGPPKEWAEGVGKAIGAFAPVYKILAAEKGWFGTGVSIEKFKAAIRIISKGIVESADIFGKNKAKFDKGNYPSVAWGQGVGGAIKAFAPVFKALSEDTGWFTSGDEVIWGMVKGIKSIASAIVSVGLKFSNKNIDWKSYPTKIWSWNLKLAVGSFARLSQSVAELDLSILNAPIVIANKMAHIAKIFARNKKYFDTKIDPNWSKRVRTSVLDFNSLVKELKKSSGGSILGSLADAASNLTGNDPITQMAKQMISLAKGYDALAMSLIKLSFAMKTLNIKSIAELGKVTKKLGIKPQQEQGMLDKIGSGVGDLVGGGLSAASNFMFGEKSKTSVKSDKASSKLAAEKEMKNNIWYVSEKLEDVVKLLSKINRSTSTIDEFVTLQSEGKIKPPPDISKT